MRVGSPPISNQLDHPSAPREWRTTVPPHKLAPYIGGSCPTNVRLPVGNDVSESAPGEHPSAARATALVTNRIRPPRWSPTPAPIRWSSQFALGERGSSLPLDGNLDPDVVGRALPALSEGTVSDEDHRLDPHPAQEEPIEP